MCDLAARKGIAVSGVTKACCGDRRVADAMLRGGIASIADARLSNLLKLRRGGCTAKMLMLRPPMREEIGQLVGHVEMSIHTEASTLRELSRAASSRADAHRVVLMVEMGDRREGVMPQDLPEMARVVRGLPGLELHGLAMNLACFAGVAPTAAKVEEFTSLVELVEKIAGRPMTIVSGGNSANFDLLLDPAADPLRINHLRVGEGILLGRETQDRTPLPGTFQNAFLLECQIVEMKHKPSLPDGTIKQDAFGQYRRFEDQGVTLRGIMAIGRQDVWFESLRPVDDNVRILGASSDLLVAQFNTPRYRVGDAVAFMVNYESLMHLFSSSYVRKRYVSGSPGVGGDRYEHSRESAQ